MSYPNRIDVPGGWIYFVGPLSHPVLVLDPDVWGPERATARPILAAIAELSQKVDRIMVTLADIQTAETEEATKIDSVVSEITDLNTALAAAQANGADQTTIQAIVDQIHANTAKLTAALPPSTTPPAATISGAGDSVTGSTDTPPAATATDTTTGAASTVTGA